MCITFFTIFMATHLINVTTMAAVQILDKQHTILNSFIAQMRDVTIQQDPLRFRRNLERIGEIMAYEISRSLSYQQRDVETPLGVASMALPATEVVLGTILRAGIPFHQGFLNYFDGAQSAFISAYRRYHKDYTFEVEMGYVASADLTGKCLILSDPMLATGASMVGTYEALTRAVGIPDQLHIAAVIASEEGLEVTRNHFRNHANCTIWCGAVDPELTKKSYIVPGFGDVGDLAYGEKVDFSL